MGTVGSRQYYSSKRHFLTSVKLLFKTKVNLFNAYIKGSTLLDILSVEQKYI